MSARSVCDMSCGQMHEFALVLDKAGFDANLVQKVVSSRGNELAEAMYAAVNRDEMHSSVVSTEKFTLLGRPRHHHGALTTTTTRLGWPHSAGRTVKGSVTTTMT